MNAKKHNITKIYIRLLLNRRIYVICSNVGTSLLHFFFDCYRNSAFLNGFIRHVTQPIQNLNSNDVLDVQKRVLLKLHFDHVIFVKKIKQKIIERQFWLRLSRVFTNSITTEKSEVMGEAVGHFWTNEIVWKHIFRF